MQIRAWRSPDQRLPICKSPLWLIGSQTSAPAPPRPHLPPLTPLAYSPLPPLHKLTRLVPPSQPNACCSLCPEPASTWWIPAFLQGSAQTPSPQKSHPPSLSAPLHLPGFIFLQNPPSSHYVHLFVARLPDWSQLHVQGCASTKNTHGTESVPGGLRRMSEWRE